MTTDSERTATVLLVDDERDIRDLARLVLEMDGIQVNEAVDGPQALVQFAELNPPPQPAVVVLDNRMPGMTGVEVAAKMLSIYPDQVIVLFTAFLLASYIVLYTFARLAPEWDPEERLTK